MESSSGPRTGSRIRMTLQNALPGIETILKSGGTTAYQFTLHDAEHAFRVAERMAGLLLSTELLGQLGDFEIAFLLLAAYLHDIGMTPERTLADRHWRYLTLGDKSKLCSGEQTAFQEWLDQEWGGLEPPVTLDTIAVTGVSAAEEVFAYYCRHRHNDWSERWIWDNLLDTQPGLYSGWTEDLITLCRSHHEDLTDLRQPRFDARVVGNPGQSLNLRYLAALLRLADVLEFDPERTPAVILRHRTIPVSSRIYWAKDHAIGFTVDQPAYRILLSARTPNAVIHNAVLRTGLDVDAELAAA